jgi:hypothetical protein
MLHTMNIFSCPECPKYQKVAFHLLRQCLWETSSCRWRFRLLAVNCVTFRQRVGVYFVLSQLLLHFLFCLFVRVFTSICHINIYCKQIRGGCKIYNSLMLNWLNCDYWQVLMFLLPPYLAPPSSLSGTFHYIPFLSYRHSVLVHPVAINSVRLR